MSRRIDASNPENLSDEDRQYLQDRGLLGSVQVLDYMARQQAAADAAANAPQHQVPGERFKPVPAPRPAQSVMDEVDEPYDKWKVDDLREECHARGLSDEGKKDELVARLMENDELS